MELSIAHVTPNEEMVNLFHSWDDTKTKKKLRSFYRAISWFSKLLKCPFPGLPQGHNRRHIDDNNALEHMLEAFRSGLSFMDYIKLALVQTENESNEDSNEASNVAEMITEETIVVVATIHCEPDCSQCKEADAIGDAAITTSPDIITEETRMASATGVAAAEVPKRAPVCKILWKAKACTVQDCKKTHLTLCKDPKCWEVDQDLPRWKAIGCKMFHGRTNSMNPKSRKIKKSKGNPHQASSQKSRSSHRSRPQTMGPIGLSAPWSQTWNQPWNQVNQVGNYQAAWTPLSRDGNNQWGNGMMPYNLVARGLSPILPSQFEKELMALVKRVLI